MSIGQHPNDIPGILTRGEIWSRVSIGLLLGMSLAVATTSVESRGIGGIGALTRAPFRGRMKHAPPQQRRDHRSR